MPTTSVGPDILPWTKAEVQKALGVMVKEYFEASFNSRKKRWKLVQKFQEIMSLNKYSGKVVLEMYKQEILKVKKVIYKEEDSFYKSNMAIAYQTRLVALTLKKEEVDDYMRRGISFTYIYNGLTDKKLKKVHQNHGKKYDGPAMDVSIEEEAKEGVVNAEELAKGKVESTKKNTSKPEEIANKSWTSPKASGGYNLNRELDKQNKQLYMGEPKKFFLMIARIITADTNPISPKWQAWRVAANQEMKAYEKELAK
jgi:hypothetical protein